MLERWKRLLEEDIRRSCEQMMREPAGILTHPYTVPSTPGFAVLLLGAVGLGLLVHQRRARPGRGRHRPQGSLLRLRGGLHPELPRPHRRRRRDADPAQAGGSADPSAMPSRAGGFSENMHKPVLAQHAAMIAQRRGDVEWLQAHIDTLGLFLERYLESHVHAETGAGLLADRLRRRRRQRPLGVLPAREEHGVDLPQLPALPRAARLRLPARGVRPAGRGEPLARARAESGRCREHPLLGRARRHVLQRRSRAAPDRRGGLAAQRGAAALVVACCCGSTTGRASSRCGRASPRRSRPIGCGSATSIRAPSTRTTACARCRGSRRCTTCGHRTTRRTGSDRSGGSATTWSSAVCSSTDSTDDARELAEKTVRLFGQDMDAERLPARVLPPRQRRAHHDEGLPELELPRAQHDRPPRRPPDGHRVLIRYRFVTFQKSLADDPDRLTVAEFLT